MNDQEFQTKVLGGVEKITGEVGEVKSAQTKLLSDVDRLDKETKSILGELGKAKDSVNDTVLKINRLQGLINAQSLNAFGNPIERISRDEVSRNYLNGIMRHRAGLQLTPEQKTAITGVDSGIGAAVIPAETSNMIYDALLTYGQWNTMGVINVGSRTQVLPLVSVRPTAYWVAQGAQITEGAMTGTSVTCTIKEAAAWIPVANATLEDSETDLSAYVIDALAQAVAYRLDWSCFAADGTNDTTDGAMTGVAVGGTAAGAASTHTSVSALTLADFIKCLTTVDAGVLQRPAKWWIHPTVLAKICGIVDSHGRPIFQNALEAPAPGAIGSILGYPVVVTGAMPSTDTTSSVIAAFGDPMAGAVGLRKAINFASSQDFQFDYNRSAFRAIARAGFVIRSATSFAMLTTAAN